MTVPSNSIF